MNKNREERRKLVEVSDTTTEVGIKLNNILTALVLMVMSWVGWNIQEMRKDIAENKLEQAVMQAEIKHIREILYAHIADRSIHYDARKVK